MKIAVASPPIPKSLKDGLFWLEELASDAASQEAEIICFPESYLPGYPGMPYPKEDREKEPLKEALQQACRIASTQKIAIILPMDWYEDELLLNVAQVISAEGKALGYQTKNQLDPTEDEIWTAGKTRQLFEIKGLKFGITICHEGFRYPESVRWAAQNSAHIVFHPHFSGSDEEGTVLTQFFNPDNPYYEKAMMMRALENTIYFASSNYASKYAESASAVFAPDGKCVVNEAYGRTGVIVADLDLNLATGFLAKRFKNKLYKNL
ncbi:carbon-nitrogen hydrolase family protein [uncultured Mucilaginibacter sp.]|uniref:carbon-nitrogen hydrolase family protein n=1 Tax=uncultured Mucilaginibacter sp. TaxID=797541 RepID=UPI0026051986|nr:carbon-nitrogen hydrolase family protein [uncultured Mucilaginibacter sp.]